MRVTIFLFLWLNCTPFPKIRSAGILPGFRLGFRALGFRGLGCIGVQGFSGSGFRALGF